MANLIQHTPNTPQKSRRIEPQGPNAQQAQRFYDAQAASSTQRAYRSDVTALLQWCQTHGYDPTFPLDPKVLALYLSAKASAGSAVSSIARALTAITKAHTVAGHDSPRQHPAVRTMMTGIRRTLGRPPRQMAALDVTAMRQVIDALDAAAGWCPLGSPDKGGMRGEKNVHATPKNRPLSPAAQGGADCGAPMGEFATFLSVPPIGARVTPPQITRPTAGQKTPESWDPEKAPPPLLHLRNRALLLVGLGGGLRRAELAGLTCEQLQWAPQGVLITLGRTKENQSGQRPRHVVLDYSHTPYCPAQALRAWLDAAAISAGPIFLGMPGQKRVTGSALSGTDVGRIVKAAAARAGLTQGIYCGHSLRAGHVTSAMLQEVEALEIAKQTGHHSLEQLRGYDRPQNQFARTPIKKLGL